MSRSKRRQNRQHSQTRGVCTKCHTLQPLTKHHLLPKRHFPPDKDSPIVFLCRGCHDSIELLIPYERKPTSFYFAVTFSFLDGTLEPLEPRYVHSRSPRRNPRQMRHLR